VIAAYIDHYHHRPHSRLNYRTPTEVRKTWDDAQANYKNWRPNLSTPPGSAPGLRPPPAGRPRRATRASTPAPPSPAQHRIQRSAHLQPTSFNVRGTPLREQEHSQPRARHVTSASGTQSKMAVMPEPEPRIIIWTDHALAKAQFLGISRADVEDTIFNGHGRRTRNTGAADWLVTAGRLAIAYSHPVDGDDLTAIVVTLWRQS
jgi:hypothetical protein